MAELDDMSEIIHYMNSEISYMEKMQVDSTKPGRIESPEELARCRKPCNCGYSPHRSNCHGE